MTIRTATAALLFALVPAAAPAWDFPGHMAIARVAWEVMTPEVRRRAVEILAAAPDDSDLATLGEGGGWFADERRVHFLRAATWPDIVRDENRPDRHRRYHHSDWHYVNLFFDNEGPGGAPRDRADRPPAGRIVERLDHFTGVLADPAVSDPDKAIALAWVAHLTGDLHQPLHATARITARSPEGDRGGNEFDLDEGNLHGWWDGALTRAAFRWFWEDRPAFGERLGRSLLKRHPRASTPVDLGLGDASGWARESFEIAMETVYSDELERGRRPPPGYASETARVARERAALAGYRLGETLNRALGSPSSEP